MKHYPLVILILLAAGSLLSPALAQGQQPAPVVVEMRNTTVAELMQALAQSFNISIVIGEGINPDARLTISAQQTDPEIVLLDVANGLNAVLDVPGPGRYVLKKQEAQSGAFIVPGVGMAPAATPVPVAVREREPKTEQAQGYGGYLPETLMLAKVGIKFSDATEIAGLFGGASYGSRGYAGYGGSSGYGGYGGGQYGGGQYGGGQYGGGQYGGGQYGGGQFGGGQFGGGQFGGGQFGGGQFGGGQFGGGQFGGGIPGIQAVPGGSGIPGGPGIPGAPFFFGGWRR